MKYWARFADVYWKDYWLKSCEDKTESAE